MICMNFFIKPFMVLPRLKKIYMPRRGINVNDGIFSAIFFYKVALLSGIVPK
jgi:hypothetical protein